MHPSISELIRLTLYPSLRDGDTVGQYPEVIGMRQRLFWLHHQELEDRAAKTQDPTSTSHTNSFEVAMTMSLVQHLIRQGTYAPDDIAVITPYLGQLHRLHREMQTSFQISVGERDTNNAANRTTLLKSVRLATVDNFQGEEAKVVVISLVRSNDEQRATCQCGLKSSKF
ncbi:AAA domain-containing protein [Xylariaceae sp. FL1272]|nr:AAA domain-containing protein [Xylariaceae sp. FL1272]